MTRWGLRRGIPLLRRLSACCTQALLALEGVEAPPLHVLLFEAFSGCLLGLWTPCYRSSQIGNVAESRVTCGGGGATVASGTVPTFGCYSHLCWSLFNFFELFSKFR